MNILREIAMSKLKKSVYLLQLLFESEYSQK